MPSTSKPSTAAKTRTTASTPKRLPISCAPISSRPLTSIRPTNAPCAPSCVSACSSSGNAPICQTSANREPWEEKLLAHEDHPVRQLAIQNELAMIRHFDAQIIAVEEQLHRLTKESAPRDYALLQPVAGIGEHLGMTILYEIGDIHRFPAVKDFLSYCRLVKGTVASAGKIKGLRGAKLGNPYLRWAFGQSAVIAKRDHHLIAPLAQRLEARMGGNTFKANTVLAIKIARAV